MTPEFDEAEIELTADELATIHFRERWADALTVEGLTGGIEEDADAAREILAILNSRCDFSERSQYLDKDYAGKSNERVDCEEDDDRDPNFDIEANFLAAEGSFFERLESHSLLFVGYCDAWRTGEFNQRAFDTHCETTAKSRRYHGIEDLVFSRDGYIKSTNQTRLDGKPRKRRCVSRRVTRVATPA